MPCAKPGLPGFACNESFDAKRHFHQLNAHRNVRPAVPSCRSVFIFTIFNCTAFQALTPPITAAVWLSASYLASATLLITGVAAGPQPMPMAAGKGPLDSFYKDSLRFGNLKVREQQYEPPCAM
jgi:hypothetical protein